MLEVETVVAVSLVMAVFSAVAAIGTSLVLGVGFERLRNGFEVVRKQTGFFSDAIHKLEQKVECVDQQADNFSSSISELKQKVDNVGEQANLFADSVQKIEKRVEIVDKQSGFFSDAIHKLEQQVETIGKHERIVSEKMEENASNELIRTDRAEALVSHAENLLNKMSSLAVHITARNAIDVIDNQQHLDESVSYSDHDDLHGESEMRYH